MLKIQTILQNILQIVDVMSDFFFLKEFQLMTSTPDNSSLLSDQDTNQFLV